MVRWRQSFLGFPKRIRINGVKTKTPMVSPTHQLNQLTGISSVEMMPVKAIEVNPMVAGKRQLTGPPSSKQLKKALSSISLLGKPTNR